jgi:hypothetical protein
LEADDLSNASDRTMWLLWKYVVGLSSGVPGVM